MNFIVSIDLYVVSCNVKCHLHSQYACQVFASSLQLTAVVKITERKKWLSYPEYIQ